ncbi:[protein-PII] uridylyltransferase [Qipengyuania sediminis]|uniref:[protein-PII] uridylyltransferase n=1 Tax=Qipengyuania sediminis TaxID=1532023 RepID=UPI00105A46D8|nr:[protein-PII] uridylyltransferase [Qipengyuania sediminis]
MTSLHLPDQRAIIDRRALAERIAAAHGGAGPGARSEIIALLREGLAQGRAELARRLAESPAAGHAVTAGHAFLIDQLVRAIFDHASTHLYPAANRTAAERIAIMAAGGYGRAEMCPHSDVDIAFLIPQRDTPWCEQVIEAVLYLLWDLGLKVGHSVRTPGDMVRMAAADFTIRTALLEGRYVYGDEALYAEAVRRFSTEVVQGSERAFVTRKLAERNARHVRVGDSRYVVEPNVKESKGGLRDLQTLYWIGKYLHRVRTASELVDVGLFTRAEYRSFRRAEGWLLAVRCHLHELTGRAEDRLTFDLQRQVAQRMRFADRPGKSAVERFMQFYFLMAKRVGALTGVFLAHIDEQMGARPPEAKERAVRGFRVSAGRLAAPSADWFVRDPLRLIELFRIAEAERLEIDPATMRLAARESGRIDAAVREDARANALFLDVLAGRNQPEAVLRWMNEAGVLGRFVPDFGRVNAQMQFDMYHHYTVDEHTIRAIGLLARIERGELAADHPRATRLIGKVASRRSAYVAVLLHDIAKGRGGDHSLLGAEVAERLCPRFGLDEDETDLVAWLVREHLLMSATAFKRDLADPKTIEDFVARVQSAERLRHLLILTVVDIRAVGPGTWTGWKAQLLGELYDLAQERLRLGHAFTGREQRVAARQRAVAAELAEEAGLVAEHGGALGDAYWIAEPPETAVRNLRAYAAARRDGRPLLIDTAADEIRGATLVTVIAKDVPGLFYRLAGGIHLGGGNIIDARIHTTRDGWALDNFLVQDAQGGPLREAAQIARLERTIEDSLAGRVALAPGLAQRPLPHGGAAAATFAVRPRVVIDDKASGRFTVIEVNARDRPALLYHLARALSEAGAIVHSAHVTQYGERAADTFYVTDAGGAKLADPVHRARLEAALLEAASDAFQAQLADA